MYCRSVLSYSRNLYGVYVKHSFWVCYRVESKALQVCDVFFLILSFPGLFSSSGIRVRSTPHGVGNEGFKTFHNYKMFSIIKASDITAWFLGRSGRVMTKATLSSLFYLSERRSLLERGLPLTVFVKILQKNWLGVFLSLKNLSRGFAPTLRYPRIFF